MPFPCTAAVVLAGLLSAELPHDPAPFAGDIVAPAPARLQLESDFLRARHPWRATFETAFVFVFNVVWYQWPDRSSNVPDWELHWDWESWRKKALTFEAVRLDSNRFSTNAGSHTEGGALVYLIGRGNGLGPGASTLLTLGEVVVWEYFAEYAEKPSINDMLTNPLAGLAVGEPFFQLSEFFGRSAPNGVNGALSTVFSPFSSLNEWADGRPRRSSTNTDRLGFTRDVAHQFDLSVGMANTRWDDRSQRTETLLGLRTEINTVPGFGSPTSRSGYFGTGRITRLDMGLMLDGRGMTGAQFGTRVAMLGYHRQRLWRDAGDRIRGSNLVAGLFNSFEYTRRERPNLPSDQIATVGLFGPTVELSHRRGLLSTQLRLEALPELGMVTALAGDAYKARSGSDGLKTELALNGYYYAYGLTLGSQAAVRYRSLAAGVDAHWEHFESFDVRDRYQERLTRNFHLVDGRLRSLIWVSARPLSSSAQLGAALERLSRFGTIDDINTSSVEHRATLTLALVF